MTDRRRAGGRRAVLAAGLATLMAMALAGSAGTAAAQEAAQEAEDWRPVDIRQEIRAHFVRLPYGWWIREPEMHLNTYEVVVNIPDWWRGNPTSAVNNLCPERKSRIWEVTRILTLRPFYLKRPWPEVDCRR